MAKIIAIFSIAAAVAALALAAVGVRTSQTLTPPKPEGHLASAVPMQSGGWIGKDTPLGATEEVQRASENLLSVNEYLSRKYVSGNSEFTLYISYWAQGKESVAKASTHVPDNCWVRNGWKNLTDKKSDGNVFSLNGKKLKPFYRREFEIKNPGGEVQNRKVAYWYIVNGEAYDFGRGETSIPSPTKYVRNMIRQSREGIPEQYFVRIDSSSPIEEIFADADFRKILNALGELILFEKNGKTEGEK